MTAANPKAVKPVRIEMTGVVRQGQLIAAFVSLTDAQNYRHHVGATIKDMIPVIVTTERRKPKRPFRR